MGSGDPWYQNSRAKSGQIYSNKILEVETENKLVGRVVVVVSLTVAPVYTESRLNIHREYWN